MSVLKTVVITLSVSALIVWNLGLTYVTVGNLIKTNQIASHQDAQDDAIVLVAKKQAQERAAINYQGQVEHKIVNALNSVIEAINGHEQDTEPSKENNSVARGQ
jgi:hypothetical protein